MNQITIDRRMVFVLRLLMGWTFFYAGAWQVLSNTFSITEFLEHTKTFHASYEPLTAPAIAPALRLWSSGDIC